MNTHLREALLKQAFKREIKKQRSKKVAVIKEEASLYSTFVEPFTDVLQAVNLGAQDFLNSYITYLRMWITFSPEKGKEILAKHDERKAKIAEKWKPLMEKTDEALSTGDADLVALVLAPQVFAMSAVGAKATEYGGGVVDFLKGSGLGGMISAIVPGRDLDDASTGEKQKEKSNLDLIDKIAVLFFGGMAGKSLYDTFKAAKDFKTKVKANEGALNEQDEKPDLKKDLATFFKDSGLEDEFEKDAKELTKNLEDSIESFNNVADQKRQLIIDIQNAESMEDFVKAFENSEAAESKVVKEGQVSQVLYEQEAPADLPDPQAMKKELDDAVESLAQSQDFIDQVKEETKKEDVTSEELKKAASKVVFLDAKKNFESEIGGLETAMDSFYKSAGEQLSEILPSEAALSLLKKSKNPESKKLIDLVEKTKQTYKIT